MSKILKCIISKMNEDYVYEMKFNDEKNKIKIISENHQCFSIVIKGFLEYFQGKNKKRFYNITDDVDYMKIAFDDAEKYREFKYILVSNLLGNSD